MINKIKLYKLFNQSYLEAIWKKKKLWFIFFVNKINQTICINLGVYFAYHFYNKKNYINYSLKL